MTQDIMAPLPATELAEIMAEFNSIFQSRTTFQLDHFVLRQHDTEPMQYLQLCMELSAAMQSYEQSCLLMKKGELIANRLLASLDQEERVDGEIQVVTNRYARNNLAAAERELSLLIQMYRSCKRFSREEIEADQALYWEKRLTRQALGERAMGSPGNFYALWQADLLEPTTIPPSPSILPTYTGPDKLEG